MTNIATTEVARAKFAVGTDVLALFSERDDNEAFNVDVFGVKDLESGKVFGLRLMAYEGKAEWRLHSAFLSLGDIWTFRHDARVKAGFKGKVMIGATGGKTYVVYIAKGRVDRIEHIVPLLDLLHDRSTTIPVADYARLKTAFAKTFMVDANLSQEEDRSVNFRETEVCRHDGLRLMKLAHISGGKGVYLVRNMAGDLQSDTMQTLAEGYLAIGHVPQAPQTAPGGKTNIAPPVGERKKKKAA